MKKRFIAVMPAVVAAFMLMFAACGPSAPAGGAEGGEGGQAGPESEGEGAAAESSVHSEGGVVEKGCQSGMQKDVITIRGVRPSSGAGAVSERTGFGPQYRMWADEVNKAGGLYVRSLDRRVMVDVLVYDDGSDIAKTTQLFEQVCMGEKPDLLLAPYGTASLLECSPVAQKYDYLLLAAEGGFKELEKLLPPGGGNTNTFAMLNCSETQAPALAKLFEELGVSSVYCVYEDDRLGIEYWGATKTALDRIGVEVRGIQAVPFDGNFDPEAVVGAAKNSGAEAFLVYAGESSGIRITSESAWQGYDPDLYLVGPGGSCDYFGLEAFGDPTNAALEGMVSLGAWNAGSAAHGAGAGEYSARFREYYTGKGMFWKDADGTYDPGGTVFQDWWGHICFYSALQVMQQAVEEAGELMDDGRINNLTLVDYIAKNSFDTAMHPRLRFNGNALTDDMYPGNIGQWQDGVFEVIDTDSRRTADPVYPKPSWHIEWPGE